MLRKTATVLVALLLLGPAAGTVLAADPHTGNPGGNCDGFDTDAKTDTSDGSILIEAGTVLCIKAGNSNTGTLTSQGETLAELIERSGLLNAGGQVPGVSNYVVYSTPEPSETPAPSAEPTSIPEPSEAPSEAPSATPDPSEEASSTETAAPSVREATSSSTLPDTALPGPTGLGEAMVLLAFALVVGTTAGVLIRRYRHR